MHAAAVFVTVGSKLEHNEFTGVELQPTVRVRWTRGAQTLWGAGVESGARADALRHRSAVPNPEQHGSGADRHGRLSIRIRDRLRGRLSHAHSATWSRSTSPPTTIATTTCAARSSRRSRAIPIELMNMLNAVTRGVEITSKAQLAPWWQVGGGYTHFWKEFSFDAGSTRSHGWRLGGERSASPPQAALVHQRRLSLRDSMRSSAT